VWFQYTVRPFDICKEMRKWDWLFYKPPLIMKTSRKRRYGTERMHYGESGTAKTAGDSCTGAQSQPVPTVSEMRRLSAAKYVLPTPAPLETGTGGTAAGTVPPGEPDYRHGASLPL